MKLTERFWAYVAEKSLFSKGDKLLLAFSGGVDSVALFEVCRQSGLEFSLAHCNFQLRGEESKRDEAFARSLSDKHNAKLFVKHFDTAQYAQENKVSVQVAARELRYRWFEEIRTKSGEGYSFILTAHHLDDNIETSLMNFFKGSGIAGLRAILPKQGTIIRPLLFARKNELVAFVKENDLGWVEDSSNESDKYTRNFFRNQILPLVRTQYPEAENNLADNLSRFSDIEILYNQAITEHKKKLLEYKGEEVHIPVLKLKKAEPLTSILFEIIRDYGFSPQQVVEVLGILDSGTGKYVQSTTHRIIKNRNWLIIAPLQPATEGMVLVEKQGTVSFGGGTLQVKKVDATGAVISGAAVLASLDASDIQFPLVIRKWKTGDYFYPLGMRKKKKLSRFIIDQKLSKTEKERVWVVEMNKKILWVIGLRIDDRFKITEQTKEVLSIKWEK